MCRGCKRYRVTLGEVMWVSVQWRLWAKHVVMTQLWFFKQPLEIGHNSLSQNDRNVRTFCQGWQASFIYHAKTCWWVDIWEDQVREDPQAKYGILWIMSDTCSRHIIWRTGKLQYTCYISLPFLSYNLVFKFYKCETASFESSWSKT